MAAADQIKQLLFNMRDEARDVHMVPGIQNTLISTNEMALAKYVTVFNDQEVNIYDQNDVEIKSNRGAVLRGWRILGEGLWRIPLETNTHNNNNTGIFIVNKKPSDILSNHPPPLPEKINNVYELKTKPELIHY